MTLCSHKGDDMETLQIRDAKASLSAVVAAAERGRPTIITRHGHPSAMVVPIEAGQRLYPINVASLASHLLAIPQPLLQIERDPSGLREITL